MVFLKFGKFHQNCEYYTNKIRNHVYFLLLELDIVYKFHSFVHNTINYIQNVGICRVILLENP